MRLKGKKGSARARRCLILGYGLVYAGACLCIGKIRRRSGRPGELKGAVSKVAEMVELVCDVVVVQAERAPDEDGDVTESTREWHSEYGYSMGGER